MAVKDVFDMVNQTGSLIQVVGNVGAGKKLPKKYYKDAFIPAMDYFLKLPNTNKNLNLKASLFDAMADSIDSKVSKKKTFGDESGYVNYDMFLDAPLVMSFDFEKDKMTQHRQPVEEGFVILEDPFRAKYKQRPFVQRKGPYRAPIMDLASSLLFMHGVNPYENPLTTRLTGFELARRFNQKGYNVSQDGSRIILRTAGTVGASFWGKLAKDLSRELTSLGKQLEKKVWKPTRQFFHKNIPWVAKPITWFDKKLSVSKTFQHHMKETRKLWDRFGGMVLQKAAALAAAYFGGPAGVAALKAFEKMAGPMLAKQDKKLIKKISSQSGKMTPEQKEKLEKLVTTQLSMMKSEMVEKDPKEGEVSFKKVMNMANDLVKENEKLTKEREKKTASGCRIIPLERGVLGYLGDLF